MTVTEQVNTTGRHALTSKRTNLSKDEREALLLDVSIQMLRGKMAKGAALRTLRLKLFSANQADYARMVGVGRKALSEIENGKGNYSETLLQKVFRPLGMVVTVIPKDLQILEKALGA